MAAARGDLYVFGMSGKEHSPDNSDRMSALIDAFAHELAEKIRENWRREYSAVCNNIGTADARRWAQGGGGAADLIDPQVE